MGDSTFVKHEPCPACGSRNNLARYSDGHAVCFSAGCGHYQKSSGEPIEVELKVTRQVEKTGVVAAIPDRRISQDTAKKYGVTVEYGADGSISKHHYPYFDKDTGEHIGSKVRIVDGKQFYATGHFKNAGLFGQHLFREGGKYLTIVEGEADALAVSEMFDGKWPVVSIRSGAAAAAKDIKENLEFIESFDSVVICFDNDKAGQDAAKAVMPILSPNKGKNVKLALKDAGEMLKAGKVREFTQEWWNAKCYRPDGIVTFDDIIREIEEEEEDNSIPYPWDCLNELTYGFRPAELVTITSGSGMGKSQILRELEHYLYSCTEDNIGVMALEEVPKRSGLGIASIMANKPLHLPDANKEEKITWLKKLDPSRVFFWKHFGSTDEDNLFSRIRYMAKGLDCKWIILDHLSIIVSDQEMADERKAIDSIMTKLRTIVQETGVGLFLVSHLRRPSGQKGHEEGGQISLSELRGSAAIAQLSDIVIGLERDQQHKDEEIRNTTTVRVLKNRFSGLTGPACWLRYDKHTGRMSEVACPTTSDESEF